MQLIEIVGPPASGKTTVMRALQRLTSFEAYAFVEEAAPTDEPLLECADSLVASLANKLAARFVRTLGAAAAPTARARSLNNKPATTSRAAATPRAPLLRPTAAMPLRRPTATRSP